jgi:hypothetical protein
VVRGADDLPSFRCDCGPEAAPSEIGATDLGVLVTLALDVGLMALVFISNGCGYDEIAGKDRLKPALSINKSILACALPKVKYGSEPQKTLRGAHRGWKPAMRGSAAMVKGPNRRKLMVTGCLRTVNPRNLLDLIKGVARLSRLQGRVSPFRADEVRYHHLDRRPATEAARPFQRSSHPRPRDLGSSRAITLTSLGAGEVECQKQSR